MPDLFQKTINLMIFIYEWFTENILLGLIKFLKFLSYLLIKILEILIEAVRWIISHL